MTELEFSLDTLEQLLVKRTLLDKNWMGIMSKVFDKRWFKDTNYGLILLLATAYYNKHQSIPDHRIISLLSKKYLETHNDYSTTIASIDESLNALLSLNLNISEDVLLSNLKEFIRRNAFYTALFDNAELLEKNLNNYEKVVDKCLEKFDNVLKITFNDTDLGMDFFNESAMEKHWDTIKNPEAKIPTGWPSLDRYTNGGFYKDGRCLVIAMALAGLGKSLFLSNLAVNYLRQNLSVVVISLEMSEDVYATRFDAHISNSDINALKDNALTAMLKIKDFYAKYPKSRLYIKEYPPRSVKTSDILTYLENLKNAGHHFDVVIVDYLNLVLPERSQDNMYKDGLAVSEKLRALSYTFNVPVITAVQSNSDGMNTEDIGMANISESRGIAHTADAIFPMYATDDDRENGFINLKIEKNRFGGRIGKICTFKVDPESLAFSDITDDTAAKNDDSSVDAVVNSILKNIDDISGDFLNI